MILEQTPKLTGNEPGVPTSKVVHPAGTALYPGPFWAAVALLIVCFSVPLLDLLRLALSDDLYSDAPLMPVISLYLIWQKRDKLPNLSKPSWLMASLFFGAGILAVAAGQVVDSFVPVAPVDHLAANICGFVLLLAGLCFAFLGPRITRAIAFPLGLMVFMIPLPEFARHYIETFLQYGSAMVAQSFFAMGGMPSQLHGIFFQLPGINLEVAPECSGIHSSLVLLILSLIAGYRYLRSPWRRTVLALAVIPLGLLRNGFRIFVIGQLCVRYGPQMLDSPIHRHGGPLFFALSLIPFFPLLFFLNRTERTKPGPGQEPHIKGQPTKG
ncbi:MAG TPA: exosortase [Verrucomicrobiae bacterium]|jgi:exosortase C (VPDSG-CTERM-specific)